MKNYLNNGVEITTGRVYLTSYEPSLKSIGCKPTGTPVVNITLGEALFWECIFKGINLVSFNL
jgi:hypothetical protein